MKKRFYLSTLSPMGAMLIFTLCGTIMLNAGHAFLWIPARETFNSLFAETFFSSRTVLLMVVFMVGLFFSLHYFLFETYRSFLRTFFYVVLLVCSLVGLTAMLMPLFWSMQGIQHHPDADNFEEVRNFGLILFCYLPARCAAVGALISSIVLVATLKPNE